MTRFFASWMIKLLTLRRAGRDPKAIYGEHGMLREQEHGGKGP
jgi:hypothetical protein